jgi:uncharacterized membrane protein YheB (UPF0754 family)
MAPPEVWGPPIWMFFHTITSKIKDGLDINVYKSLFRIIKTICKNLPCPTCSTDATIFLSKINEDVINSKQKLINNIYIFHNYVNTKNKKTLFNYNKIVNYNQLDLAVSIRQFIRAYNTSGNMNLLNESFQRQLAVKEFRRWMRANISAF